MKRSLLPVLVLAVLLTTLMQGSSSATAPSQVTVSLMFCDIDCESADISALGGTITCSAGEEFFLRANVRQFGVTVAVGRAHGTCTGAQQSWQTSRMDNPHALDCSSPHSFQGSGRAGGTPFRIPRRTFTTCG